MENEKEEMPDKRPERKDPMKKERIKNYLIMGFLAMVVIMGFFMYNNYAEDNAVKELALEQEIITNATVLGAQMGYQKALNDIASITADCKTVPLNYMNRTITLVAGECLKNG